MPTLHVEVFAGRDLASKDSNGFSDPYLKMVVKNSTKGAKKGKEKTTAIIKKTLNPTWNESFTFDVADPAPCTLRIQCMDKDTLKSDFMGEIFFPLSEVATTPNRQWYPVQQKKGGKGTISGDIEVSVFFMGDANSEASATEAPVAAAVPEVSATEVSATEVSASEVSEEVKQPKSESKKKSKKSSSKKEKVLVGRLYVSAVAGRDLASKDSNGFSDPFCKVTLRDKKDVASKDSKQTAVINKTLNPEWNEELILAVYDKHVSVRVVCLDKDALKTDFMGQVEVNVADIESDGEPQWMPVQQKKGGKGKISGDLLLGFRLARCDSEVGQETKSVEEASAVAEVPAPAAVPEGYESESNEAEPEVEEEEEEEVVEQTREVESVPEPKEETREVPAVAAVAAVVPESAPESKVEEVTRAVETESKEVSTRSAPTEVKEAASKVGEEAKKGGSNMIVMASVGVLLLAILMYFLYAFLF